MTLLQQIIDTSLKKGHDIAIVDASISIDYSTLRRRSNAVAHCLLKSTCGSGQDGGFVAILLQRTADFPIAVLGILKAGMAYVPLSTENPEEYNRSVLLDSNPIAIISSLTIWNSFPNLKDIGIPIILIDEINNDILDDSDIDQSSESRPAALFYTSGTTGKPKAVLHSLYSMSFLCEWFMANIDCKLASGSKFACVLDFCFIACIPDMFVPLMIGGTCLIVQESIIRDVDALAVLLKNNNVIHLISVGNVVNTLIKRNCGVKYYNSTGGSLPAIISPLPSDIIVKNVYGMTEFGVGLSYNLKGGEILVPIGKPALNTKIYLLDYHLMPVEKGQIGEIFICTDGLAIGYWHNSDLTHERFIDSPFEPGKRMFRTGDYARELPIGDFIFCGRKDDMVKVNGVRLNKTDIENAALSCSEVTNATVVVNENGILCLLYSGTASRKGLVSELKCKLPADMMPGRIVCVDTIPVNSHGKIDKNELRKLLSGNSNTDENISPIQEMVLSAMCKVLGIDEIGLHDDFFDFGGDSLHVINLLSNLPELPLKVETVYRERTAERIAKAVNFETSKNAILNKDCIHLTPFQMRILESQLTDVESTMWNNPICFRFAADCDIIKLNDALHTVIDNHPILSCTLNLNTKTLHYSPFSTLPIEITVRALDKSVESEFNEFIVPFQMSDAPLWRIKILVGEDGGHMFMDFHHLIFDGTSLAVFMGNLYSAYCGKNLHKDCFFDYAQQLSTDCIESKKNISLDGWTFLPFPKCSKSNKMHFCTTKYNTSLSKNDVNIVENKSGISMNVLALAATGMAMAECTSKKNVAVNWLYDNRTSSDIRYSFGAFIKMFTIFLELEGKSYADILQDVRNQVDLSIAGITAEYINDDVYYGRDPILINNLTGMSLDTNKCPFGIQRLDFPYCIKEMIEYLDVELFYRNNVLCFNIAYGSRGDVEDIIAFFADKFMSCLKSYFEFSNENIFGETKTILA